MENPYKTDNLYRVVTEYLGGEYEGGKNMEYL